MIGKESREIGSEGRIPTMREKLKNEPSFKFYDDDSHESDKQRKCKLAKQKFEGW